ncbi:MAG: T9SS type A sorting domain-containing protein [Cyclobacteriaceae bacterium]|nr:T9SS type A sorting domain-containing protein [Cyclobacteriaceae bacterium]
MKLKAIFLTVLVGFSFQPGYSQFNKLTSSQPQGGAAFGYDISQDGNYLIVGAKDEVVNNVRSGAAYIYHFESGDWVEQAYLLPDTANDNEFFGISVALSGDFAMVGANGNDEIGTNSGIAYVYKRSGDSWSLYQSLTPESLKSFDEFGISIDISNNVAVVGAYSDATNGLFAGAAYVFEYTNSQWVETAKLLPAEVESEDKFGRSVDTDGKRIIVCRVLGDEQGADSGVAYIFSKDDAGNWQQEAKLLAPDGEANDRFGRSVGIANEYAAVGAVLDDDNGNNSGSAYIFRKTSEGWVFQDKVIPSDGEAEDFFGYALAFSPGYLLVGALNKDGSSSNTGAAYLFSQNGSSWSELQKFSAPEETELANFGESVDINEKWITIGAPYWSENDEAIGSVFLQQAPVPLGFPPSVENEFSLFPNPSKGVVHILTNPSQKTPFTIEVYNATGKLVLKDVFYKMSPQFTIDALSRGIYFVVLGSSEQKTQKKLLID